MLSTHKNTEDIKTELMNIYNGIVQLEKETDEDEMSESVIKNFEDFKNKKKED